MECCNPGSFGDRRRDSLIGGRLIGVTERRGGIGVVERGSVATGCRFGGVDRCRYGERRPVGVDVRCTGAADVDFAEPPEEFRNERQASQDEREHGLDGTCGDGLRFVRPGVEAIEEASEVSQTERLAADISLAGKKQC